MCLGVNSVCRRFHYSEASFGVHPIHLSAKFTFIRGEGVSITVHDVKISFNASTANLFPFPWPLENSWPRFEGDGLESRRFDRNLRREKCVSRRRFILVCLLRERKRSSSCVFDENWIERRDRCFVVSFLSSFISLVQKDGVWKIVVRREIYRSMKLFLWEEKFKFLEFVWRETHFELIPGLKKFRSFYLFLWFERSSLHQFYD